MEEYEASFWQSSRQSVLALLFFKPNMLGTWPPLRALDGGLTGGCFGNSSILGDHSLKADSYQCDGDLPICSRTLKVEKGKFPTEAERHDHKRKSHKALGRGSDCLPR